MSSLLNENKIHVPYMRDLSQALSKVGEKGYVENFKATEKGLVSLETSRMYQPDEVKVVNFYRFEGVSDPDDMSILYVIEANDGSKGTLVDAFGMYSNPLVEEFMKNVEIISKD